MANLIPHVNKYFFSGKINRNALIGANLKVLANLKLY